jgi:hypothetical protein
MPLNRVLLNRPKGDPFLLVIEKFNLMVEVEVEVWWSGATTFSIATLGMMTISIILKLQKIQLMLQYSHLCYVQLFYSVPLWHFVVML